jgi:hypothetical protein
MISFFPLKNTFLIFYAIQVQRDLENKNIITRKVDIIIESVIYYIGAVKS